MSINLVTRYQNRLANLYTAKSFLKGKTSNEWEWDGSRNIKILSVVTQALNDYDRTAVANRYGTPAELQDSVQTIGVYQDKSFSIVVDRGNLTQQNMLKKAGQVLSAEVGEQVVPCIDKYALNKFALYAGKVADAGAALTKSNIIEKLVAAEDWFSDHLVPLTGRFVCMKNANVSLFRQSLTECDDITDRLLLKGIVGKLGTLNIVGVPASWMPANTELIAFQTRSVVIPEQISEARIHEDPQGFSGNVLEGRYLFDAGVVAAFKDGCYCLTANGKKAGVSISIAANAATVTGTNASTILYTTDGSDPRYSDTAQTYASPVALTAGQTIRACGYTAGSYGMSDVIDKTNA